MTASKRNWPELLMGLGIMLAGIIIGWEAASIRVGPLYSKVGPAAFLWASSALLFLCGSFVGWKSLSSPRAIGTDIAGPSAIMAGLAISPFLMETLGFVLTSVVVFMCTAFGLGSRKFVRDVVIALILAVVAYLAFSKGLGLKLPQGILPV